MEGQIPFETELIERANWLIRLRWLVALGAGVALALGWLLYPDGLPLLPLLVVVAIVVAYNIGFLLYARTLDLSPPGTPRLRQATRFVSVQVLLDLLALVAFIHLSGGAESLAAIFLVFLAIVASLFLPQGTSLLLVALAVLLFASVAGLEYVGVLAHYHPPARAGAELYRNVPFLLAVVGMMALVLGLTAYFLSAIRAGLRQGERDLWHRHQVALDDCRELETVNVRLRQLDAERTRFITLVAHELRAPINTIHTCVELALAGYASPEKVRDILERVQRRTADLSELISDLLRLARAREETSRDEGVGLVQPADVLESVVQLMRAEADKKDLFLSVDVDPDLALVRANPERFKLVWTNLLSNAIKYTEPGGIVAVSLKQTPGQLVGTVRDTGIGIPPEDQQRIFEEFYRAENAREVSSVGTGVGLAIVRRIIENWGGTISVESEQGLGSKFTFVLPRADL